MRRHLEDHPNLNSNRAYGNSSALLTSINSLNLPTRVTLESDARVGSSGVPITTVSTNVTSSNASSGNLVIHHSNRTAVNNLPLSGSTTSAAAKPSVQRQPLALIQETVHSVGSGGEMQSGVQFSLPSGFQSRVAAVATTLAQANHSQSTSSLHSIANQAQTHASQVLHPGQINSQSNVAQTQGQQMQFQRLKVEDALSYLDQVKFKFGNQPQVYNDFLDIMKEFKSQSIDTPGVIQRVSTLFKGHPELIVGFNTFLPPGYRIEVQSNEQVQVSIPGTNMGSGAGSGPTSLTINPCGTITTNTQPVHTSQMNHTGSHGNSPHHSSSNIATKASLNHQSPVTNFQTTKESSQNQHLANQSSPAHTHSSGASPGVHSPNSTPQANQPVEFNHAINYVNKIKNRFQGQPDIYKQFLEILHTYQKEQRNLKDGVHTSTKPLTEAEVYAQVAKLFQNQEDLLQGFGQFLPDANGAANALVSLQPPKSMNSDHPLSSKKPMLQNKPLSSPMSTSIKQVPTVKRLSSTAPSMPTKKPKMTVLKDVTLAEATKCGTLTEFAFFDKVRKALKSQEAYDNFLRLLILYNQELITRGDLVLLIAPFLSKFPELFKWFKDFLGYKDNFNNIEPLPNKIATQERERVIGEFATEIDYSSCKRYGASYRAVPRNYVQPKCSGRTALCKEVLNDTWVSFPSWSEDSTFVSSRKTQFEEHIYRCEDERFELDVILDSNRLTINTLESVHNKINRMSAEEKAKFRLDDYLGGSSNVLHQRSIKRVYGDKANDIIEGLKKSPAIAAPLIMRRLKGKEDEWRRAQKGFNKQWKDTNEKYYLKSLDHQGITFKQNDVKCLRSKNLLNEIETVYEERHEQAEDGIDVPSGPHIVITYKNKDTFKDAANLIIHHVKRQTGIHKEDKQRIKQLMRQFVPDLFSVPRGDQSDDEMDKDDMEIDEDQDDSKTSSYRDLLSLKLGQNSNNSTNDGANFCSMANSSNMSGQEINNSEKGSFGKQSPTQSTTMENSIRGDSYALFFINSNWYVFFRLHHILCERLVKIYERAQILIADEIRDKEERKKSTAEALKLKPKVDASIDSYYASFLEMIKNLLDGNIESNQYEDMLREMFGIDAFVAFTLDKAVQNIIRQLQHIVGDDVCTQCTAAFLDEQKNKATGGTCTTATQRAAAETSFQKRVERILNDETCYRMILYKNEGKLTFELLDSDADHSEDHGENEKWCDYFGKFGVDSMSNELKEQLAEKPVFLPRNVRSRRQQKLTAEKRSASKLETNPTLNYLQDADFDSKIDLSNLEDSTAGDAVKGLVGLNAKSFLMDKTRHNSSEENDLNIRSECKFNVNSYKRLFVVHSESYLYTQMALRRAHQFHQKVSQKLNKHFHSWHKKWLMDNVSEEDMSKCQNWLLGLTEDNKPTTCIVVDNPSKPPYACFNRYRVPEKL